MPRRLNDTDPTVELRFIDEWRTWHSRGSPPLQQSPNVVATPDEDNEDTDMSETFTCAHCLLKKDRRQRIANRLEVPINNNDRICRDCAANHYLLTAYNLRNPGGYDNQLPSRQNRWIVTETSVVLRDISERCSLACARQNYFRYGSLWFFSMAAMERWESNERQSRENNLDAQRRITQERDAYIFGYHEVNNISLFGWPRVTPEDGLCFGVELEMENRKDSEASGAVKLSKALGGRLDEPKNRFVLARDGSLGMSGIELITNPYTLDYHQRDFGWKELMKGAIAVGGCAGKHTERCGMHVHVNRAAISPLTLGKALIFVNADRNRPLIERIAQRSNSSYARIFQKTMADGRKISTPKYEAMHLTERTIEFRIFRGNLRAERILKNIEFCHSVFMYVPTISVQQCADYVPYLRFLTENAKQYPNLIAFLREKDTIAIRKGAPQIQITEEI